ncbi:methyltransferase domain-containing protein [Paenibacillus filicis]|uniref:Methyltransferase domain-containing protein n=1 Tax=Paenibacillus gyeongsangnamensis TaxID=3388067 RepID=A0ABT4Q4Y1_9BACL|nr:methyltransferase domain-containing protein [Paenibacillus filicis]MCZ8511889.1 methyltransferase domain-containing protein [Paenibacillus filicis]
MFSLLRDRAEPPELMDDLSAGGAELREALQHLRRLNRIYRAAVPTLYGVQRLWHRANRPRRFSVLDIGCGSGDVNRRLLRWAEANGIELSLTLVDVTEEACEEARAYYRGDSRVRVRRGDLYELPEECAEVVTGTQFLHHFADKRLEGAVRHMVRASRWGTVINDIHRHAVPWAAVWITTRLMSRNRYIRHDGPLSVAKGFRSDDWEALRDGLGEGELEYRWMPLFRYAVIIPKRG